MPRKKADPIATAASPGFEEALRRLEEIVSQLEHGEAPLETALILYEEGVRLARTCSVQVRDAERRVMLLEDKNGELKPRLFTRPGEQGSPSEEVEEPIDEGDPDDEKDDEGDEDDPESQEQLF